MRITLSECVKLSRGLEGSIHVCQSVVLWESLTGHVFKINRIAR
jgi:hypothetical protein